MFSMSKKAVLLKLSNKKMGPYSEGRKWVSVMIEMQLSLGLVNHCAMKTCRNGGIVPAF